MKIMIVTDLDRTLLRTDKTIFERFGCAMGEVTADCVCGTNDDDGVAQWIEQNIL